MIISFINKKFKKMKMFWLIVFRDLILKIVDLNLENKLLGSKMDTENNKGMAKMSGYLEKKGRKKMMSCYKKYWFVLEGKLLLYYRSKEEYEAISPCKGSINMGPTCNVKPCCLRVGVFQIVSRTTTITLRAESREEQHKWMQAIMTSLNQHNTPTRLSHFRYSLGELSPEPRRPLERQNTMPERLTRPKSGGFIEKLQRIGVQAYGGYPGQNSSKPPIQEGQSKSDQLCQDSVISENDKYETCCKKLSISDCESIDCSFDRAYERIPSRESISRKPDDYEEKKLASPQKSNTNRPTSLSTDNSNYYRVQEPTNRPRSLAACDQSTYCDDENCPLNPNTNNCNKIEDYLSIYTEPKYEEIDFNKNSVSPKKRNNGSPKCSHRNEHMCHMGLWTSEQDFLGKNAHQYAEIGSCDSVNEERTPCRKLKGFGKTKNKLVKSKSEEKKSDIKKSESFLQRVWKKKYKNKSKCKENDRETSENLAEQNLILPPLNILQDVLDDQDNNAHQEIPQRITMTHNEERRYENWDSVRQKLHGVSNPEEKPNHFGPPLPPRGQKTFERSSVLPHDVPKIIHALKTNELSPRTKEMLNRISLEEIMQDIEKERGVVKGEDRENNDVNIVEEAEETSTPKRGKTKVKDLIKKFDLDADETVELRQRKDPKTDVQYKFTFERDSSELHRLLDELSKVTTAPIMTPGVTSSLVNPEMSDEELLKLIPIRKRRSSDPDYDVPRSYQSLTNLPTKTEECDLRGTRFFGPILRPFDIHSMEKDRELSSPDHFSHCPSMTPDSLEMERQLKTSKKNEDGDVPISYHSHDYLSFTQSHHKIEYISGESHLNQKGDYTPPRKSNSYVNENIYDTPKNILRNSSFGGEENDSAFIDSLETYPQVGSTAF